jgi:pyruvate-formate lyase-activating enzyme
MNLLAEFLASASYDRPLELLSYHELGINKYRQLDMEYALAGTAMPEREYMMKHAEKLQQKGVNANVQK